jgi:hypothetical protein
MSASAQGNRSNNRNAQLGTQIAVVEHRENPMCKISTSAAVVFVAGLLGLACSDRSGLNSGRGTGGAGGGAKGGQTGGSSGGTIATGGVSAGSGGAIASGGVQVYSGGAIASGGVQVYSGGAIASGGVQVYSGGAIASGGVRAGGTGGDGAGTVGTSGCPQPPHSCPNRCPGGWPWTTTPSPDPCDCPIQICGPPPDAGVAKDSSGPDTPPGCPPIACPALACPGGYLPNPDPCGCPICGPPYSVDAGTARDGRKIDGPPPCRIACPALACPGGYLPNPDPCTCPVCAPTSDAAVAKDVGGETSPASCTGLDECACFTTTGCTPIAEPCWCPFPQCNSSGACICGGGRFFACAPQAIATCAGAKARVAALCPTLKGPTFDGLCTRPAPACVTKCLAEVSSCSDVFCSFCETCDCAGDQFSNCYAQCANTPIL